MKKIVPTQSLLNFYIVTLIVLTALSYFIVFITLEQQQRYASEEVFDEIYYDLSAHLENKKLNLNELLSSHTDQRNVSYKIMVISPSGQPYLHSYRRDDQSDLTFFTLPYWEHDVGLQRSYQINSKELLGWASLPSGFEAYIQIIHPPSRFEWSNPLYWLPILAALLLLFAGTYISLKYRLAWQRLIDYTNAFPIHLKEPYAPLRSNKLKVGREFQRLSNSLNRINQQLHQNYRRTKTLHKRLHRITDFSPLPMLMINRSGHIAYFNRRFEQSFMTGFQENITYFLSDFLTGKDKHVQLVLSKLGELKIPRTLSVTSLDSNTDYLLHLHPWTGEQGQIQGFMALLTDISTLTNELKDIDIKIQHQADKLVEFDKLWSVIGHELRTPLSGMIGLLELMDVDNFSQEQQETYDSLQKTSANMLSMLNDMLDMAKMEAGKLKTVIERTDLLELCEQVMGLMSSNARRQNIELLLYYEPSCPRYVDTDSGRVRQALMNLLSNAIKFTKAGYVALHIKHLASDSPELKQMISESSCKANLAVKAGWICFRVLDTGIGISDKEKSKLFSHFGQANDSISRQFGGTGLGLAISNNFVQLLGGFIHVDSCLGHGSQFTICLPISQASSQPPYHFHTDLSSICLIAFCNQQISTNAVYAISNYLGLACKAYTGVTVQDIEQLSSMRFHNLSTVLIVDEDLYRTADVSLIHDLPIALASPKILLSMHPKSALPHERKSQYDAFLTKPLIISHLVKELLSLSSIKTHREQADQSASSKAQASFEQFMQRLETQQIQTQSNNGDAKQPLAAPSATLANPLNATNNEAGALVLVAEDNPINQKVACKILEKLGYRTISAKNGQQVLELLSQYQHNISLILMDCRMPILDGLEATRLIRANQNSIPIIALTANDTDADREECMMAGMNDFLPKPIKKEALLKLLQKFMVS